MVKVRAVITQQIVYDQIIELTEKQFKELEFVEKLDRENPHYSTIYFALDEDNGSEVIEQLETEFTRE